MSVHENDPGASRPHMASAFPLSAASNGDPVAQPYPVMRTPGVVNKIGKTRNPWGVWLLSLVTLGIYWLWWYYTVNRELRDFDHQINVQPGASLLAMLFGGFTLGIATLVSIAKTGGRIATCQRLIGSRSQCSAVVGLLLFLVGFGNVYYQSQLNKVWDAYGNPPEGSIRPG